MPYEIGFHPDSVFYKELDQECPEARPNLHALLIAMKEGGPSPDGFPVKTLGKGHEGLWQINLKVNKRQIRILYAPYGQKIVVFRIHKKSSPQEQNRAYELAAKRKREYENNGVLTRNDHQGRRLH